MPICGSLSFRPMFLGQSASVSCSKKYLSVRSPLLLGITVHEEVISKVNINLFSPRKLTTRNVFSA